MNSMIEIFRLRWQEASGEYIPASKDDFNEKLISFLKENSIRNLIISYKSLKADVIKCLETEMEILTDLKGSDIDKNELKQLCSDADAGLTCVDGLIADTGTLVTANRHPGDRTASSLPPVHIVNAIDVPLYRDISNFLEQMNTKLSYTLITGPSRTADIEKKLVLGAHGPLRVVVFGPA